MTLAGDHCDAEMLSKAAEEHNYSKKTNVNEVNDDEKDAKAEDEIPPELTTTELMERNKQLDTAVDGYKRHLEVQQTAHNDLLVQRERLCRYICLFSEGTTVVPGQTRWDKSDDFCLLMDVGKVYNSLELESFKRIRQARKTSLEG
jgi:hypothetical protein